MVLKLKGYSAFTLRCAKMQKLYQRKVIENYQKKYLSQVAPFKKKILKNKVDELVQWYDEFTGMDEVRKAQKRVLEDEENFRRSQEERRRILNELKEIQYQIKELYAELDGTNRGEDRYVQLVTQEHKLLKEEKLILDKFTMAEKDERDSFAALSSSVKLSHEKERAQGERTKYWSIIGSVMGTVIGILGTSINNHFKINELKELIKKSSNPPLNNCDGNEQSRESTDMKVKELLDAVNSRLSSVENSLKNITLNNQHSNLCIVTDSEKAYKVIVPIETLTETIKNEYSHTKILLYTLAVLSVFMPLIAKYN